MVQLLSWLLKLSTINKDMYWLDWKVFSTKFDEIKGKISQPIIYVKNQPNKLDWFGSMFCSYMYHTLKGFYQLFEKKLFFNRLLQFASLIKLKYLLTIAATLLCTVHFGFVSPFFCPFVENWPLLFTLLLYVYLIIVLLFYYYLGLSLLYLVFFFFFFRNALFGLIWA